MCFDRKDIAKKGDRVTEWIVMVAFGLFLAQIGSGMTVPEMEGMQSRSVRDYLKSLPGEVAVLPASAKSVSASLSRASASLTLRKFIDRDMLPGSLLTEVDRLRSAKQRSLNTRQVASVWETSLKWMENRDVLLTAPHPVDSLASENLSLSTADLRIRVAPSPSENRPEAPAMSLAQILVPESSQPPTLARSDTSGRSITLSYVDGELHASPRSLTFTDLGQKLRFDTTDELKSARFDVFVRDESIVEWDPTAAQFVARAGGSTELFVTADGQLLVIPVTVESPVAASAENIAVAPSLQAPAALYSVVPAKSRAAASIATDAGVHSQDIQVRVEADEVAVLEPPSLEAPTPSREDRDTSPESHLAALKKQDPAEDEAPQILTLSQARRQVMQSQQGLDAVRQRMHRTLQPVKQSSVALQFVDDRTVDTEKRVLPAGDLRVRIVGTQIRAKTDAAGVLPTFKAPAGSRLLLAVDDPLGRYQPTMAEVTVSTDSRSSPDPQVIQVPVTTQVMHETIRRMLNDSHIGPEGETGRGSLCATFDSSHELDMVDAVVESDIEGQQAVYFNRFGFVDVAQPGIGPDQRACFFDVDPGPIALTIRAGDSSWSFTVPTNIYPARHGQIRVALGDRLPIETSLVAHASAEEHLVDPGSINTFRPIEWAELFSFSNSRSFLPAGHGRAVAQNALAMVDGRAYYMVESPEFEPTVYTLSDRDNRQHATALIPYGFVDRLSIETGGIGMENNALGSVLVEYGRMQGEPSSGEPVRIELFDYNGAKVISPISLVESGNASVVKSVFLDLEPGVYAVLVTTPQGHWLASDTAIVYSETTSYVSAGSRLAIANNPEESS